MTELTDQLLLQQFRESATKERAFTMLVKRYQERLYWHIRRMLVTHEDTDDVLQATFIKMWKGLQNFREDSKLYTWLYRIATNESLSFMAQQKRKATISFESNEDYFSNALKADADFDAGKIEWKLQLALQQLPEKQKLVFSLRYYDELPYEEMSEILDTSVGALKASYHHAAKKVEEFLLKN